MIDINKITLIGRLTKDTELKYVQNTGTAVVNVNIAVERRFAKEGQTDVDFIPIVIWGKQAESTAKYTAKGKLIAVSGRIQTRNYDHKDGYKVYITEVVAEEVKFLEYLNDRDNVASTGNADMYEQIDDGDIPF